MTNTEMQSKLAAPSSEQEMVATDQFALLNGVKPGSILSRLSRTGGYFGVVPERRANGRLLWPSIVVKREHLPQHPAAPLL